MYLSDLRRIIACSVLIKYRGDRVFNACRRNDVQNKSQVEGSICNQNIYCRGVTCRSILWITEREFLFIVMNFQYILFYNKQKKIDIYNRRHVELYFLNWTCMFFRDCFLFLETLFSKTQFFTRSKCLPICKEYLWFRRLRHAKASETLNYYCSWTSIHREPSSKNRWLARCRWNNGFGT